jgi:hypothetical protein
MVEHEPKASFFAGIRVEGNAALAVKHANIYLFSEATDTKVNEAMELPMHE